MGSNQESTGIREGNPPHMKPATAKKPKNQTRHSSRARILVFAYSSAAIPPVVFFLSVYVLNSGLSETLQRCFFVLLEFSCGVSGILSVVSLTAIKTADDFVAIFVGAFFGLTGSTCVGFFVFCSFLMVGLRF